MSGCRVLVFGYSWFGPYTHNPAEEAAAALDGTEIDGCRVEGIALRVSASYVMERVRAELERGEPPRLAVGLGLNPRASSVILELASVNIAYFRRDVDGNSAELKPILAGGPDVVGIQAPVKRIYEECRKRRLLPLEPGVSIGTYLCNMLAYLLYTWALREARKAVFLHVPPHTKLALRNGLPNYRSLGEILDTVKCVIQASIPEYPRTTLE